MEGRIGNQHPIKKERHGLRRKSNLFKTRSWGIFYVTSYYLCIILLHVLVTLELLFLFLWRLRANCVIESGTMLS
jgi:NADH:ubiquinone oxidoreductase subunit 3 (subunit A)